jgi:alkylation response protein AidB-like acyl-CoA dehydrogenase
MNTEPEDLDTLTDDQFRLHVRGWIEANYPAEIRNPPQRLHFKDNQHWYMKLAQQGWLCPNWPKQFGGMGISASKQLIFLEEKERHGCARVNDMGMTMIGPLLIKFGRPEQQQHFLPKILAGEHIWCQGYSEPNAGSDLASLRTEAVLDGDHWVVNGQKIWTSLAMDAQLDIPAGPHRQAGEETGRHQLPAGADGHTRYHRAADHQHRYGGRILRDLLRQRARPEGQPRRPDQQRLDHGQGSARF